MVSASMSVNLPRARMARIIADAEASINVNENVQHETPNHVCNITKRAVSKEHFNTAGRSNRVWVIRQEAAAVASLISC